MPSIAKSGQEEKKKIQVDYKARLERQLYLAKENPEPVFDLSDCNLKKIPDNIFSLCKVFRKEALYLQKNFLTSLSCGGSLQDLNFLKVLDISSNLFTQLPSDIKKLTSLEVLKVSDNRLQELPKEIGDLENLVLLDVSFNKLKKIPDSIANCKKIKVFNISGNLETLKEFPTFLVKPLIDPTQPAEERHITFLNKNEEGEDSPSTSSRGQKASHNTEYSNFQEQILLYEKQKAKKQEERLAVEKQLMDNKQREFDLQQQLKNNKNELLKDVKNQQETLNAELSKIQLKKDTDRALLIKLCRNDEERANQAVTKILNSNKKERAFIMNSFERERKLDEEMLFRRTANTKAMAKQQILKSMDEVMREEIEKAQKISSGRRYCAVQSLASEVASQDDALNRFLSKYEVTHSHLIETLRRDQELQKTAVASLLEKSDSASWELAKQIAIIEAHLAELTKLELSKRKLESHCQLAELSKSRLALAEILMDLFKQQAERREHLVATIRKMEVLKETVSESETFWMEQYQKLLSSKSHEMVKVLEAINPNLIYKLFLNGVFHYLPLLKTFASSKEKLEKLNMNDLKELGIENADDRSSILRAVESFINSERSLPVTPSAPESTEPTAPVMHEFPFVEQGSVAYLAAQECVICLETKPNVIFFPCGHICCCYKCFTSIALCPLCRKPIDVVREIIARN